MVSSRGSFHAIVVENAERAAERGARIYGELAGFGFASDAMHIADPAPDGRHLVDERTAFSCERLSSKTTHFLQKD